MKKTKSHRHAFTPSESFNEVSSAVSDTPASEIETNQTTFLVLAAKTVCRKPYGETAGDFKANGFDESTLERFGVRWPGTALLKPFHPTLLTTAELRKLRRYQSGARAPHSKLGAAIYK